MSAATDQLPPHDDQAEAGALACVMISPIGEGAALLDQLDGSDFYDIRHREIYTALAFLRKAGKPLDVVALAQRLRDTAKTEDAGGTLYIATLPDQTPSEANFPSFLDTVRDRATRRATVRDAVELAGLALDPRISEKTLLGARRRIGEVLYHPLDHEGVQTQSDPWLALVEDGADMQVRELPPVVEIVQGIVAEHSKLALVSSAKCFKTWVTIYLALAISHKADFLGRPTVRRRVLYVNLELKPQTFVRRLQAIAGRLGITIDRDWFSHLSLRGKMAGLSVHEVVSRIITVARARGVEVYVIDPVFKLNVEGEENSSRDQTVFFNELDRITTEGNATLILNDHSGKGNQSEKDPLDVIRGSSAKGGDLDAAMVLRKHDVEGCFRVDLVHRELAPVPPFVIGWNYPVMELRSDLDPEAMKKPKAGRKASHDPVKLLSKISDTSPQNPISISEWARRTGIRRQNFDTYLPEMRSKGWIMTAGEGFNARQYITAKGQKVLETA